MITALDVGGAEVQLLRRVRIFLEAGLDVVVCSLTSGGSLRADFERAGARVVELHSRGLFDPLPAVKLAQLMARGRFDVVHCHLFRARLWGIPAARMTRVRMVIQSEHILTRGNFESRPHTLANRLVGIALGRLSDVTVAISKDTSEVLRSVHRVPPGKVQYVPNGIFVDEFGRDGGSAKPEVDVVALGRLHEAKGFDDLVRALALLRERGQAVTCEIAGTGPLRNALEAQVRGAGLSDAVRLVGVQTASEFIRRGRVFAMPSRWESFGIAALEAMAAGVPVIATAVDALPELVEHGRTGLLVAPNRPGELAGAIAALLGSDRTRAELAQNAREMVRRYDLRRSTERLLRLYEHASAPRGDGRTPSPIGRGAAVSSRIPPTRRRSRAPGCGPFRRRE